jgi:putative AlgH/UPF0301 family transcriptional regulator
VLEAISTGSGPRKVLISLGYSAWGEGQLESELGDNSWLTVAADARLIFETPVPERYTTTEARSQGARDADAAAACIILEQFLRSLP